MDEGGPESFWRRAARRVARQVNLAWVVERATPWLVLSSLAGAVVMVCVRTWGEIEGGWPWAVALVTCLVFLSLAAGWVLARPRFIGEREGLVRLEDRLGLANGLSVARDRLGPWPEARAARPGSGFGWRMPRTLLPLAVSSGLVIAGAVVPIPEVEAVVKLPPAEPRAREQVKDWLDQLEEKELVDEEVIEEWRGKIAELRSQPEEEWFSHAGLEASDTLRDAMRRELERLASDAATAERALDALRRHRDQLGREGQEEITHEAGEAIKGLQTGEMSLSEEWRESLESFDLGAMSQGQLQHLTPEELQAMQDALCQVCEGLGGMSDLPAIGEGESLAEMMERLGLEKGEGVGRGGVSRGPGEAPLFFGDETELETDRVEKVTNEDRSRLTPGDLIGLSEAEHDHDPADGGSRDGGAIASPGTGGDAVWRDSLMPAEKRVLERYFR